MGAFIKTAAMLFHGRVWTTAERIIWAQLFHTIHDWALLIHRQGLDGGLWSEIIKCTFMPYSKTFVNVFCINEIINQKFFILKQNKSKQHQLQQTKKKISFKSYY